ncbi:MAG: hypothetical protein NVS9B1_26160 [Candidatus Dormibacteraceae bacterium]
MGHRGLIDLLLSNGAPLDFFTACVIGRRDLVEDALLTQPQTARSLGVHGLPAMYFAALGGDVKIAALLFEHGADARAATEAAAPIHAAVMGRSAAMVQLLLDHGADRTAKDFRGRTAADLAALTDQPDLALLLEA